MGHGVHWDKNLKKWRVQLSVNNKNKHIGVFNSILEAADARKQAAREYYGEFAPVGGVS